ncbi:hypothetical protein GQ607_003418, partial [Colletotrichum asianum]
SQPLTSHLDRAPPRPDYVPLPQRQPRSRSTSIDNGASPACCSHNPRNHHNPYSHSHTRASPDPQRAGHPISENIRSPNIHHLQNSPTQSRQRESPNRSVCVLSS